MKVKSESEVAQSCPTLSDPQDCSLPGSSIHGIFQARVLEWGAIAFSVLWIFIYKPLDGHMVLRNLGKYPGGEHWVEGPMPVVLLHIPLLCATSTTKLMYFGRAAKLTRKGINSVALVQMSPPNETNRHPDVVLLSFNLSGRRSGCCLGSWPLCDMERVLIVLLGLPGVGWSLSLISLMLRACSQLLSDCSEAKGTWTILKFHRNFYKWLNEENWFLFEVSKFTIVWLFLLVTFFFYIGVEAMHSAPDLLWLRYYQTFFFSLSKCAEFLKHHFY